MTKPRRPPAYLHLVIAALAVAAPLAMGGALPSMSVAISIAALMVAAAVVVVSQRRADARLPWIAVAAFGVPLLVTTLQLVPLNCDWLPSSSVIRQSIEELNRWGFKSARCKQTLAPATTQLRLIEWCALFSAFAAAHWLASTRGPRVLYRGLVASATVMALVAVGHWLVRANAVFGLYEPLHATDQALLAPLLNTNHFAGLMVLGLAPSVALTACARDLRERLLWGLCAALLLICLLLSLSRAGIALGLASLVPVAMRAVSPRRRRRRVRSLAIAGIAVAIATAGFVATELVAENEDLTALDKLEHVAHASVALQEHPWLGVGRGALPVAAGLRGDWLHRKTYVENLPIQWGTDWGVPIAVLSLACFWLVFRRIWRWPRKGPLDHAVFVALLMLSAQNLLDFSLELPGVALVAVIALGALTGAATTPANGASSRQLTAGLVGLGAVLMATVGYSALHFADVYTLDKRLRALEANESSADLLDDILDRAVAAQPHEAAVALWVARAHASRQPEQTFRWLNRTMRLAPEWADPHLLAAELLMRRGASGQAILELGEAAQRAPRKAGLLACEFERFQYPHEPLLRIIPQSNPWHFAAPLIFCLESENRAFAEPLGQAVLRLAPEDTNVRYLVATLQLKRGSPEDALQTLNRSPANDPSLLAPRCRALVALEKFEEAVAITEEIDDFNALACRVGAQSKLKDAAGVASSLERLDRAASQSEGLRVHALAMKSTLYYDSGNYVASVAAAQEAYRLSGEVRWLERAHGAAVKAGLLGTAYTTRRELCRVTRNLAAACRQAAPR